MTEDIAQPSNLIPKRTTGFELSISPSYSHHHNRPSPLSLNSASPNPFTARQLGRNPPYTYDGNLSIDPAMLSQQIRSHSDSMTGPSSPAQTPLVPRRHRRGSGYNHSSMELISESLMDMVQYNEAKQEPMSATLASPSQTSSGSSGNYTPYGNGSEGHSGPHWAASHEQSRPPGHRQTVSYSAPRSIPQQNYNLMAPTSPRFIALPPSAPAYPSSSHGQAYSHSRSLSTPGYMQAQQSMMSPTSGVNAWDMPQEGSLLVPESFESASSSVFGSPATGNAFSFGGSTASPGSTAGRGRSRAFNLEEDDSGGSGKMNNIADKKKKRREAHNLVERRRRDGINTAIQQLSELLPDQMLEPGGNLQATHHHSQSNMQADSMLSPASPSESSGTMSLGLKPNKGVVLARTVEYVIHLKQLNELQAARNQELEQSMRNLQVNSNQLGNVSPFNTSYGSQSTAHGLLGGESDALMD